MAKDDESLSGEKKGISTDRVKKHKTVHYDAGFIPLLQISCMMNLESTSLKETNAKRNISDVIRVTVKIV